MQLPKNERRVVGTPQRKKIWVYGQPYTGKTMLADQFPDPIMLNTDGNTDYVTAPYIPIRDEVRKNGRITETKMAWEVFKEAVTELTKKDNTFRTVVVDLVEDVYAFCREFVLKANNITHESDDPYRAWDKVRSEFLTVFKHLTNLDYENIVLISHEDISKDITKKNGDKATAIRPNITDKIANKIAGMVGLTCRTVIEDGKYLITFKTDDSIEFGGGRFKPSKKCIPNSYEELCKVYETSGTPVDNDRPTPPPEVLDEPEIPTFDNDDEDVPPARPVRRKRNTEAEEEPQPSEEGSDETVSEETDNNPPEETKPVRRTRRVRD